MRWGGKILRPGEMDAPRSILIVMLSALGDAVQVLPLASALRRAFPETFLGWVVQPTPFRLVRHHPAVDRFVLFRRRGHGRTPRALLSAAGALAETAGTLREVSSSLPGGRFDLLLDLQVYFKAGLVTALTPARVKLGFDARRARDLNGLFVTHRIPPHPRGLAHIQDQYFEFLQVLGVDPEPLEYRLEPTPGEKEARDRFFRATDAPACGVVVGTSDPRKNWKAGGYARVVEGLVEDFGLHPVLLAGPSRRDTRLVRAILESVHFAGLPASETWTPGMAPPRATPPLTLVSGDDIRRLLWILDGCSLVISPDTGPLHVARALDVPVVGLYGGTDPRRSGPYRKYTELVVDEYPRRPEEDESVRRERRPEGMERIRPEAVLEKVALALERYGV